MKQQKKNASKGRAAKAGGIPNAGSTGNAFAGAFAKIGLVSCCADAPHAHHADLVLDAPLWQCTGARLRPGLYVVLLCPGEPAEPDQALLRTGLHVPGTVAAVRCARIAHTGLSCMIRMAPSHPAACQKPSPCRPQPVSKAQSGPAHPPQHAKPSAGS